MVSVSTLQASNLNNEDSAPVAYQIMNLKGAIDGDGNIDGFNQQEILDMYNFICCNLY